MLYLKMLMDVKTWKNSVNTDESRVMVSAADYDLDGDIDLIFPGALGSSGTDETAVFQWDPVNNEVKVFKPSNNHDRGTGRIAIGDTDGDGGMNALFVSGNKLINLNENFQLQWDFTVTEGSATGYSGVTLYDFNGDGKSEILYRDRNYFKTFSDLGTNAQTILEAPCKSFTREEYPVVADLDNDGQAEICFSCLYNNTTDATDADLEAANTPKGVLRVYGASNGSRWQPTRGVWNQHAYMNVNIADDLSIPTDQNLLIPADKDCYEGDNGSANITGSQNKPLNMFMSQAPLRGTNGCPSFALPDLKITDFVIAGNGGAVNSITGNNNLLNTDLTVSFKITNTGSVSVSGDLPITFYARSPINDTDDYVGAKKLNTISYTLLADDGKNYLEENGVTGTIIETVTGIGADFTWPEGGGGDALFAVINESGSAPPFDLNSDQFPECGSSSVDDNYASFIPDYNQGAADTRFTPTIVKLSDNIKCMPSKPDNGEARAYYDGTLGGTIQTIFIEDFEDNSITNQNSSNLLDPSGNWTATGGNTGSTTTDQWGVGMGRQTSGKTFTVNNSQATVVLESKVIDITDYTGVKIDIDAMTNNTLGSEDLLTVFYALDGGSYTTQSTSTGALSYEHINLSVADGNTSLKIKIEIKNNDADEYTEIDNIKVSGTLPNTRSELTETDGFEFLWSKGGSLVHTGSRYTGMADGTYTVKIRYIDGGVEVDQTKTSDVEIELDEDPTDEVITVPKLCLLQTVKPPMGA